MEIIENYEVKLDIFEGPLDLLVYLVQKNELCSTDIPISLITDQYLIYVEGIGIDNLSNAGEFLVMASRLMLMKAHELLPNDEKDEIEDMEFDLDKESLIQQMIEHQKFKGAAKFLKHLEVRNFGVTPRGVKEKLPQEKIFSEEDTFEAGIYELLTAYANAIKSRKNAPVHQVEIDDVTIENQIKKFQHYASDHPKFHFEEFFQDDPRNIVIVVSFMALLELCKLDEFHVQQYQTFDTIWVYCRKTNTEQLLELGPRDMEFSSLGPFNPGLVEYLQEDILKHKQENTLEQLLGEIDFLKNTEAEDQSDTITNSP